MPKPRSQPPTPAPVVLVVLPDEVARQIHRQLIQVTRISRRPHRVRAVPRRVARV